MERVAIVILNYNGRHFLEKFLNNVIQRSSGCRVVVADNQSTDDSIPWLREHFPHVEVIINPTNGGFATGYNLALAEVKAEYYVLLNSDVDVTPGWVEPVVAMLDANPNIGAVQPKIRSYHKPESFEYAGAAGGFLDPLGYPCCRGRIFDTLEKDLGQYNDSRPVFWATGACMFVRSHLYHQLGGLDDDFFAHMEEIDLCWRLQHQGMEVWYCADSVVYHVGGGTLSANSPFKTYLNFRNNLWLITKNLPVGQWMWKFPLRLVLDGVAGIKFLLDGSPKHTFSIVKAHLHAYLKLPKMWRKRTPIRSTSQDNVLKKWLFVQYFLRKKRTFAELDLP